MTTDPHGPLHGLRVLDASRVLAGPSCAQTLGDLGAEILKIERPGSGDETRTWGPPFVGTQSAYFLSCNRNKRSLTLDLGRAEGKKVLFQLVEKSDILLENFLPENARRLGLTPESLHAVNPRLIVCSISGYGRTGPWKDHPGYDFAIQARSGLMSITGPVEGPPSKVGVAVTDVLTGLYAATAILACVNARASTGHGYAIDMALLDCALAAQVNVAQAYLATGTMPPRQGNAHLQIVPYQTFATADRWIVLAIGNDSQWQRLCQVLDKSEWVRDPRFAKNEERVRHRTELVPLLEEVFQTQSATEWESRLEKAEIPCAPVWDYAQLLSSPQAQARGLRVSIKDPQGLPIDLLGSPFHIEGASLPEPSMPPTLGQHTRTILHEWLGMPEAEIDALKQQGIV